MHKVICTFLGLALISTVAVTVQAQTRPNFRAFNHGQVTFHMGAPVTKFTCPDVALPVTDMSLMQSSYDPTDKTQSKIDPARVAAQASRKNRITSFGLAMSHMSDQYVFSKPSSPVIAACLGKHLASWARAGALLQNVDVQDDNIGRQQAGFEQAWALGTYATVYYKTQNGRLMSHQDRKDIEAWLNRLADAVMLNYDRARNPKYVYWTNNLRYWAGYGVGMTGVVFSNRDMLEFAQESLQLGLNDIDANGALKAEMKRGARAMHYQNFALAPLLGIAHIMDANGMALSSTQEKTLNRAVRFTLVESFEPVISSKLAGIKQPGNEADLPVWGDLSIPRLERTDPALARIVADNLPDNRVAFSHIMGGRLTPYYNFPYSLAMFRTTGRK